MRSVPRSIDRKGEHLSRCDVCGVPYLRSALRRGDDNLLRCPEDHPGRDAVLLSKLTAARAAAISSRLGQRSLADGAFPHTDSAGAIAASDYPGPVSRRTAEDVYASGVPTYSDPGTLLDKDGF